MPHVEEESLSDLAIPAIFDFDHLHITTMFGHQSDSDLDSFIEQLKEVVTLSISTKISGSCHWEGFT